MNTCLLKMCSAFTTLLAILFSPIQGGGQTDQPEKGHMFAQSESDALGQELTSPEKAADLGLELLHQLKEKEEDEQFARSLGFASVQEARQASRGTPLQVFSVSSKHLVNFQDISVPDTLFFNTNTLTYPLEVHGHALSSLSVVYYRNQTWRLTRIGSATFIASVERNRTPTLNFIIMISDLGLRFLADRTSGEIDLVPVSDAPHLKVKQGVPISVHELASRLAKPPGYSTSPKP
jgi:hypothetical protein